MIKPVGGLDTKLIDNIIRVITSRKKVEKIVLFGSRATSRFKKASDIDLAIYGNQWTSDDAAVVKFNLNETLSTALKFDVVLFDELTKRSLIEDIEHEGVVLYP